MLSPTKIANRFIYVYAVTNKNNEISLKGCTRASLLEQVDYYSSIKSPLPTDLRRKYTACRSLASYKPVSGLSGIFACTGLAAGIACLYFFIQGGGVSLLLFSGLTAIVMLLWIIIVLIIGVSVKYHANQKIKAANLQILKEHIESDLHPRYCLPGKFTRKLPLLHKNSIKDTIYYQYHDHKTGKTIVTQISHQSMVPYSDKIMYYEFLKKNDISKQNILNHQSVIYSPVKQDASNADKEEFS